MARKDSKAAPPVWAAMTTDWSVLLCGKESYVRLGNTTRVLDSEETVRYVQTNWE